MRALQSDFLWRFAGGFLLGGAAVVGLQLDTVRSNLGFGTPAHVARVG